MEIYEKLALIQEELKAPKTEFNSFGKFSYRTAENILQAVKPIAKKYGCVVVLTDTVELVGGKFFIKSVAELISFDFVPNADKNTKSIATMGWAEIPSGKRGMDQAQECGTATSYARKYSLGALFGITNEKDSDSYDNTKADKDAEKETAMQRNQARLDAEENWRVFAGENGDVVLVKAKTKAGTFEWKNIDDLTLKALEYLKTDARFEGIGRYVNERIAIIKGGK